ncbi:MAG: hypothetical protein IPI92_20370, partial [Gemmatimonadetes bacterium]|nr:hypothetical protein [Gemmatimonadota bacterium]
MKKKTKRLLAQLGHKKLNNALKRAIMMRCALRVICNWSIQDADDEQMEVGIDCRPITVPHMCECYECDEYDEESVKLPLSFN